MNLLVKCKFWGVFVCMVCGGVWVCVGVGVGVGGVVVYVFLFVFVFCFLLCFFALFCFGKVEGALDRNNFIPDFFP